MKTRFIVDSHIWLWWYAEPYKLGLKALTLLEEGRNQPFFSVASAWEIAIKYSLKKLPLPEPPRKYLPARLADGMFSLLDLKLAHTLECSELPLHHKDPFDRLIVAQAKVENIPVLTADPVFAKYGVKTLAAA